MMKSGFARRMISTSLSRSRGSSNASCRSSPPAQTTSLTPASAPAFFASFARMTRNLSGGITTWPRWPLETWHTVTVSPRFTHFAIVPEQAISMSSGWAPIARTFMFRFLPFSGPANGSEEPHLVLDHRADRGDLRLAGVQVVPRGGLRGVVGRALFAHGAHAGDDHVGMDVQLGDAAGDYLAEIVVGKSAAVV